MREVRKSARERGYTTEWDKARELWLAEHPLCAECERAGILHPHMEQGKSHHVDHIVPHRGDMDRFWDQENWQTLCVRHHNEKTAGGE